MSPGQPSVGLQLLHVATALTLDVILERSESGPAGKSTCHPLHETTFYTDAILSGRRDWEDLSRTETRLLDEYNNGEITCIRDDCDAAFGWNKQMRIALGSAAGLS